MTDSLAYISTLYVCAGIYFAIGMKISLEIEKAIMISKHESNKHLLKAETDEILKNVISIIFTCLCMLWPILIAWNMYERSK